MALHWVIYSGNDSLLSSQLKNNKQNKECMRKQKCCNIQLSMQKTRNSVTTKYRVHTLNMLICTRDIV